MFVIEADQHGRRRWISGIFRTRADAEALLGRVPETLSRWQQIVEVPFDDYPVYVVEADGFRFLSLDGLKAVLEGTTTEGDDSVESHLTIYKIERDFAPRKPGEDSMGLLPHIHVDDRFLRRYQAEDPRADPFDVE